MDITVKVTKDAAGISLKIKDSGVGIPEEQKKEIFGEYSASQPAGTKGESGTGLGLGICKKIIDAHCFKISFESTVGKGTEFCIVF